MYFGKTYQKLKDLLRLLKRSFLYQTHEFFQVSTLHGVRYINEPGRPFIERCIIYFFLIKYRSL